MREKTTTHDKVVQFTKPQVSVHAPLAQSTHNTVVQLTVNSTFGAESASVDEINIQAAQRLQ